jgi:phage terminase large subunit-like protein
MSVLMVPQLEDEPWPSLGAEVCDFIESCLVFGPGDLRGEPARLDDEKRALITRAYQVYPQGHLLEGRRRFKRVAFSLRKGSAKSELAAWLAAAELSPDGPVRTAGWDGHGNPIGGPVTDPYLVLCAYTEEQSEEIAYGALRVILELSRIADDFDIGLERIMRRTGDGKAVALATAPDARDGARTTWQHFDETHRFTLPRLKQAHRTMLANIPKRKKSDAWSLETTTAPAPGQNSVAEDTWEYARKVADGSASDTTLFFFHRQASDNIKLYTDKGEIDFAAVRAAVNEASGPVAGWSDLDGIVDQWRDPTADKAYLERVWLNRLVQASDRAFDSQKWKALADPAFAVPDGSLITLGFDGARTRDATAIVATHIESGYQWLVGCWERPFGVEHWEVPQSEVESAIEDVFARYDVWRMYCDPPHWNTQVSAWAGKYGGDRVMEWWTDRKKPMAFALQAYDNAIRLGEVKHSGDKTLARHLGNACRRFINLRDDNDKQLWLIYKERPDSPMKIDAAMAACLAWEARNDAIAAGVGASTVYKDRGILAW